MDERREAIMVAAVRVFSKKGFAAAKISDIAREADISQGLLYHYFASKEDIHTTMIRTALTRMNEAALALAASPLPARQKIEKALVTLLGDIETHESFAQYVMLIAQAMLHDAASGELQELLRAKRRIPYDVMAEIFAQGKREGSVKNHDPEEMAALFWTVVKGLAMHKASWGEDYRAPDPRMLLELFLTTPQPLKNRTKDGDDNA